MNETAIKFLISAIVITIAFIVIFVLKRTLSRQTRQLNFNVGRKVVLSSMISALVALVSGLALLGIWGVQPEDVAIYAASVFTIIGIAFFAQWSHLANITAAFILYMYHPIRIGDTLKIFDATPNPLQGTVSEIGLFFVKISSEQEGMLVIPNSALLQNKVSVIENEALELDEPELPE